jgi:hypothetical protein
LNLIEKGKKHFLLQNQNKVELRSTPLYCNLTSSNLFILMADMTAMTHITDMTDMKDMTNMTDMKDMTNMTDMSAIVLFGFLARHVRIAVF